MEFLDVKTDYAFKRVFGSEESVPILRSFLNALLEYPKEKEIVELTIVDPYQVPPIKGMKDTYVDVKAVLRDGTRVIIEMQVLNVEGFEKRILYNAAKAYSQQLKRGENYTLLNPVIALTLTDFLLFKDSPDLINRFKLIEKQHLISYSDDIELVFVELPKFDKDEAELENMRDKWIYFVKNAGSLAAVPSALEIDANFRQAFDIANTANMTEEELEAQHKRHDFIYLQRNSIEFAAKQGLQQGLQQGLEQGIQQERMRMAQALLKTGMELAEVLTVTGLSADQLPKT